MRPGTLDRPVLALHGATRELLNDALTAVCDHASDARDLDALDDKRRALVEVWHAVRHAIDTIDNASAQTLADALAQLEQAA